MQPAQTTWQPQVYNPQEHYTPKERAVALRDELLCNIQDVSSLLKNVTKIPLMTFPFVELDEDNSILVGLRQWSRYKKYEAVFHVRLQELPGCCGTLVLHHAWTHEGLRRRGIVTWFNGVITHSARQCSYGCLLCTIDSMNTASRNAFDKSGFETSYRFLNHRTQHVILVMQKELI